MAGGKTYYLRVTVEDEAGNSTTSDTAGRYCWGIYSVSSSYTISISKVNTGSTTYYFGVGHYINYDSSRSSTCWSACIYQCRSNNSTTGLFDFSCSLTPDVSDSSSSLIGAYLGLTNINNSFSTTSDGSSDYFLCISAIGTTATTSCTIPTGTVITTGYLTAYGTIYRGTSSVTYKNSGTLIDYAYSTSSTTYNSNGTGTYNGNTVWYKRL